MPRIQPAQATGLGHPRTIPTPYSRGWVDTKSTSSCSRQAAEQGPCWRGAQLTKNGPPVTARHCREPGYTWGLWPIQNDLAYPFRYRALHSSSLMPLARTPSADNDFGQHARADSRQGRRKWQHSFLQLLPATTHTRKCRPCRAPSIRPGDEAHATRPANAPQPCCPSHGHSSPAGPAGPAGSLRRRR